MSRKCPSLTPHPIILSPIQNKALLIPGLTWIQQRPKITQEFGANPEYYKQFGFKGHSGIDLRASIGTKLYSPIDGDVIIRDSGDKDYGRHMIITNGRLRVILAHLSDSIVQNNATVHMGDYVALSGNSGASTAPHLHMTVKMMHEGRVMERNNGYGGGFDFAPYLITFKGTIKSPTI